MEAGSKVRVDDLESLTQPVQPRFTSRLGLPMARYTSLFTVAVSFDRFRHLLSDMLKACHCDIIYDAEDYLVAREVPGRVAFAQLVTVEVLIEKPASAEKMLSIPDAEVRMSLVVKNEELPLKSDNHCRQMFNLVNQAIVENRQWHLIECVAG